jgi:two-component system sensor histidine kinase BarA
MELDALPVIDWELAARRCGNQQWAQEMVTLLIERLPSDMESIKEAYKALNYTELLHHVHKLHGAIAYCGLPRLNLIIASLETNLKNHIMDSLPSQLDQLDDEVTLLLKEPISLQPHYSDADKKG